MKINKSKFLVLIMGILSLLFFNPRVFGQERMDNKFLVLTLDNAIIGPVIADYISRGIDEAQDKSYTGIIIQMDTPGGLLESTRVIVKKIMNASVPVIVYITPSGSRAGSAGVFITLAAHIAAMAPSTNIGAAHPVVLGEGQKGENSLKKAIEDLTETLRNEGPGKTKKKIEQKQTGPETETPMEDKILNDTLAWISTIAKSRGRNAEWAKQAVLKSVSATEKEALENKVINLVARDLKDLLKKLDSVSIVLAEKTIVLNTKNVHLVYQNLSWSQNILSTLINPNIAYILMLIGFLGLFIEITHPGIIAPGIVGVICLILAFYAFAVLPINSAGLLLIGLAIILFIAEALTPLTFGVLTLAGIISMLLGSLMLIESTFFTMRISLGIILPFVLSVATIVIFLATNVVKAHAKKVQTGSASLIGKIGIAQTAITDVGQIFLEGEIWTAINQSPQPIQKGEKIKVVGVDKVKLLVLKA